MWIRLEKPLEEVEKPGSRSRHFLPIARLTIAVLLVLSASTAGAQQSAPASAAAPAAPAPREAVPGVKNFGRVTPQLYRGAQPTTEGFGQLQKMGVEIVVDLRNEKDQIEREKKAVASGHMKFVSIPWNPWKDPTGAQVKEFFEVLTANPGKKVFVHCNKGADRTGTMVALYRIAAQQWKADDALQEMKTYHLHAFWFPHLERYVENFPQQLETDPALRGALAPARPTSP